MFRYIRIILREIHSYTSLNLLRFYIIEIH